MRKAKKILCAVLAAAMLLSSMPMSAFAAEAAAPSSPAQTAEPSAEPAGEVVPEEVPPAAADPAEAVDATGPPAETAEPSASPAPEATAAPSAEPTEAPSTEPEAERSEDHGIATIWYREFDGQLLTSGQDGLTSSTPNSTATFGYVGEILTRYMAAGSSDTSNGTAAYCVQQGVETNFPADYMQGSIGSYYRSDIADLIGDILTAGYATDNAAVDLAEGQTANASRWAATQIALWEATRFGVTAETWHTARSNADALTVLSGAPIPSVAQSEYNSIIAAVVGKRVKPSFDGDSVTLTWDGEKYTATLTDRNNVLSEYDYAAAGFTFQKSGNQLTVSTDTVHESPVTATATHNVVGGSGQAVLWVGSMSNPSLQRIVSYAGTFSSTPVISTFTVKTEAMLTVHLTKTSADVSISGQNSAYSLEGAEYGVYSSEADAKADRNQAAKFVTNAAGKAEVNLKPGVYYVKELKAPKGFVLSDTVHQFNVTSTSTTFDVQDDPSRVQITVRKKDAETGTSAQGNATLAGAVYRISYTQNGESVQKDITTDASGVARLGKIPLGKITVQEITAPKGYKLDGTVHTYTVTATDRMALEYELEPEDITDAVIKGRVQLQKKAEQADGSTKPEQGAVFEVFLKSAGSYDKAKETERDLLTTNGTGTAVSKNLPYGVYTVHQRSGGSSYMLADDFEVNISKDAETYNYEITNRRKSAQLKIVKTAEDGIIEGLRFRVTRVSDNWTKEYTTDAQGVILTEALPIFEDDDGEVFFRYKVEEISTPERYVQPDAQTVTLKEDGIAEVNFTNVLKKFTFTLKKTDAQTGDTPQGGATLAGAVFGLFKGEDKLDEYTVGADGTFTSKEYVCGEGYTVREIRPPKGYLLSDTVYKLGAEPGNFTVEHSTLQVTATNEVIRGGVLLEKRDAETGLLTPQGAASLDGTQFEIRNLNENPVTVGGNRYGKNEVVMTITVKDGVAQTANNALPYGHYSWKEVKTGTGYLLTDGEAREFDISANGQTVEFRTDKAAKNRVIRGGVLIEKRDAETGLLTPQGAASLDGTQFEIRNLSDHPVIVNGKSYKKDAVVLTVTVKDGVAQTANNALPYGHYSWQEVKVGTGYLLTDGEAREFDIREDGKLVEFREDNAAHNQVIRGGVLLEKRDAETGLLTPQGAASLDGTQFEIRNLSEHPVFVNGKSYKKDEVVLTVTVKDGVAQTAKNALPYGHYSWKEVKVGTGYLLTDGEAREFDISSNGQTVEFRDDKAAKNRVIRGGVLLEKRDAETGLLTPQGAASLDGTQFEIRNLNENPVTVGGNRYGKNEVVLTVAVKDGVAQTETDALPYGHYSWQEVKVGTGYLLTDGEAREFDIREDGKLVEFRKDNAAHNQVIRGDIDFIKVAEDDMHRLVHVPFRLTSETTGESHILVTDENGYASTEADWNPHTADTNCNDDKLESGEYNLKSGVWFGADAKVNDELGALPFDTYTLEELRCEANVEYDLITVKGITVSRNTRTVHLGTIDDRYVPQPEIWTAAHGEDGGKTLFEDEQAILVDELTYTNLPKRELVVRGVVMDKATGKPILQDGEQVTAEKRVTPRLSEGSVEMEYTLDTTGLGGHDLVVFEYVYEKDGKTLVAEHADLEDLDQTVTIVPPEIGTTAYVGDGKDKTGYVSEDITIRDIVHYKCLTPGKEVRVEGVLMDKASGKEFLVDGKPVTSTVTFTPEKSEGDVEVTFTFNAVPVITKSTSLVVFESMYHEDGEMPFVVHKDLEDEGQTVTIVPPEIGTTAYVGEGEDKTGYVSETVTIRDIVHYKGLTPGKPVRVEGILMDKTSGEAFLVNGKPVTSSVTFTPEKPEGDVEVTFVFNGVKAIQKSTDLVVFEEVYYGDSETAFAVHANIEDEGQTVTIFPPEIGTTAYVGEGEDKTGYVSETVTIRDIVHYKGLTPGKPVRVEGTLMDKASGKEFLVDGKPVTSSVTFTPEKPEGDVEVTFVFNGVNAIQKSTDLVVFESMYHEDGEMPFVVHTDLEDEGQTVTIFPPEIGTTAYVGEGEDKTGYVSETVTICDIVHYKGLTPGNPVRVEGTLMDKTSGEAFLVDGKPVTASAKFTPEKPEGDVEVTFVFNGVKAIQKSTDLVVFESMYHEDEETPFVVHTDLEDEAQTVTVEPVSGTVRVVKTNADRPEEKLSGAKFSVYLDVDENGKYDEDVDTPVDLLKETTEKGVYSLTGLGFGKYLLHEEKAPEGFTADEKYYPFEITENGATVDVENAQGHGFTNIPNYSGVRVVKTNAAKPEERLTGAKFAVYRDKNGNGKYDGDVDAPVDMLQETEKGVYTLDTLRKGKYLLHEEAAPEGFIRDENYYPFEIKADGEGVTVENEQGKGFTNQPVAPPVETPQTGDNSNLGFWIGLGATAIGALAALLLLYLRKKRDGE